ncbi:MAG: EthD family reductase [Sinobacteraceae bacterium]|nr:EthD family reductase [Nevskiaceae bacterium]MBV8855125.1 EthD family reductase [Nevskiaceae bacterium]MBV9911312.1 EthD family reductase [Nevskiaceae bacterium]
MIRVCVLYPSGAGIRFDMAYYTSNHMPMVMQKCGPACRRIGADLGVSGGAAGMPAPYVAIGYLEFDSVSSFESNFNPHAREILADIPNYTNAEPLVQVSEIKL